MIAQSVFLLCALTSVGCAVLLFRGLWGRSNALLLSSAWCFTLLAIANLLLFVDLVIVPSGDLSTLRTCITAAGHLALVIGLISKPS